MARHKRTPLGSMAAVVAAVILILFAIFFRHGVAGVLWSAGAPLVQLRNAWSGSEVTDLRAQLASSSAALADRDLLAQENAQLRAELGRLPAHSAKELLAGVLQSPPGTPYDTLVIDAGSALGVREGQRVYAGGLAIGEIDAVYADTARVSLYSAPGRSYQALLTTAKGVAVPLSIDGQGAGSFDAQVPQGTEVAVGDNVVFAGIDGGLSAKVTGVSASLGESFKTIYLHVPVNLFELRYIYIEQ
jgi:rod shape-determining protein MreC